MSAVWSFLDNPDADRQVAIGLIALAGLAIIGYALVRIVRAEKRPRVYKIDVTREMQRRARVIDVYFPPHIEAAIIEALQTADIEPIDLGVDEYAAEAAKIRRDLAAFERGERP